MSIKNMNIKFQTETQPLFGRFAASACLMVTFVYNPLKIVVLNPEDYTQIAYPVLWTEKYFFLGYSSNE